MAAIRIYFTGRERRCCLGLHEKGGVGHDGGKVCGIGLGVRGGGGGGRQGVFTSHTMQDNCLISRRQLVALTFAAAENR
jgi:hypothetical protein